MFHYLAILVLSLFPLACVTVTPISVKTMALEPGSGKGIVLGSMTRSMDMVPGDGNQYQIQFRNRSNQKEYLLSHTRAGINILYGDEIKDKDDFGTIIARDLPAGDYEIFQYSFAVTGYGGLTFRGTLKQPLVFHVKAGEITYIGELKQTILLQMRHESLDLHATVLSVHDQSERDIKLLSAKFPELSSYKIEKNLAQ